MIHPTRAAFVHKELTSNDVTGANPVLQRYKLKKGKKQQVCIYYRNPQVDGVFSVIYGDFKDVKEAIYAEGKEREGKTILVPHPYPLRIQTSECFKCFLFISNNETLKILESFLIQVDQNKYINTQVSMKGTSRKMKFEA